MREETFLDQGEAEKLAGSGKKIKSIPPQERFLQQKQKKRYSTAANCYQSLSC